MISHAAMRAAIVGQFRHLPDNANKQPPEDCIGLTYVREREEAERTAAAAIPMRLTCPDCGQLHVDEGEWATRVHSTHSCQSCGLTWRPAVVATVGVRFLPGFKNEAAPT